MWNWRRPAEGGTELTSPTLEARAGPHHFARGARAAPQNATAHRSNINQYLD